MAGNIKDVREEHEHDGDQQRHRLFEACRASRQRCIAAGLAHAAWLRTLLLNARTGCQGAGRHAAASPG